MTLTPENPEQLRKRLKEYEGVELEFGLHPILQGLARALDRIEELEKEREPGFFGRLAARVTKQRDDALSELSALKAKMETRTKERDIAVAALGKWAFKAGGYEAKIDRLTAWCETEGKYGDRVLAVLDGKEG